GVMPPAIHAVKNRPVHTDPMEHNMTIWNFSRRRLCQSTLALCGLLWHVSAQAQDTGTIQTIAQALNEAQVYNYGDSGAAMDFIQAEVVKIQPDPEKRNALANTMVALLGDPLSTDAFKEFVCKQLYLIGGEEQI